MNHRDSTTDFGTQGAAPGHSESANHPSRVIETVRLTTSPPGLPTGGSPPSIDPGPVDHAELMGAAAVRHLPVPISADLISTLAHLDDETSVELAASDEELVLRGLPPWLSSVVFHLAALIALGLIFLPAPNNDVVQYDAVFADKIGDQLESDLLEIAAIEAPDLSQPEFVPDDSLTPVDSPLATPPDLPITLDRGLLTSDLSAPTVGLAFLGRTTGMKQALLRTYGGDRQTEEAVALALEWLASQQRRNGTWSLQGPYADGASQENVAAATAMALLAFEGAGHTHRLGKYQKEVERGVAALLRSQSKAGTFYKGDVRNHRPYTQALSALAICELYGMTQDEELREPIERAVRDMIGAQSPQGGWRYEPKQDSDTSVTGWYLMALVSARAVGIDVPSDVFERIGSYLDLASSEEGARYSYVPQSYESPAMTAEGLLCRQYLGWRPDDPRMLRGVDYLLSHPIDWSQRDTYYWYYGTQVMFHLGGYPWEEWNRKMKAELPERQERIGRERGSWTNKGDRWGGPGGRLFTTCLSTYMLEVYYRRLPIYSPIYEGVRRDLGPSGL